ncbi:cation transporter [Nocardioides caeni]|uniref:Cation-transporting ATPase n=1 Tax=Nocardioides caeni TaxID=574700 RepID=A0A4S8MZP8_9ACTN|nr:cation transporter [Nocardioides caeni]THV08923.1 cation-transporting ATPase [Nocardioides caeni]
MSTTTTWTVTGMTCGHCAASVTEEVTEIPGVEAVDVTVATGTVVVTSTEPIAREAIDAAVTEAGYTLV